MAVRAFTGLVGDIVLALTQMLDRRFLGVLFRGVLLAIVLLGLATWGMTWLVSLLPDTLGTLPYTDYEVTIPEMATQGFAIGLMLLFSIVLMFPVAAVFVGFFLDDIAEAVERKHYPNLPEAKPLGLMRGLIQAVKFAGIVVGLNLVLLLAYLFAGPLAPLAFYAVNGYLLGREYFQVVAERRLPLADASALRRKHQNQVWLAGVAMSVPLSIPILNLAVPVAGVAVMTHLFHRVNKGPGSVRPRLIREADRRRAETVSR